ncbi:MAG: SH3 domain-containing protein [Pelagibaca sp.]
MNKYILIAFAVMAMAFYELSGGADFEPGDTSLVVFADPKPSVVAPQPRPEIVARSDNGGSVLTDIAPARAVIEPVVTDAAVTVTPAALETEMVVDAPGQAAAPAEEVLTIAQRDLRFVDGDRVNLRGGPGTDYAVVGRLVRNDMVEILQDEGNGWLHLRATETGDEGWMAERLVTAAN